MSAKHLTTGDLQPAKNPELLRLYSMLYCPFAQRARLVLKAKNIPHDIVNVNLIRKPDWLFVLNPKGQIPILDEGNGKVTTESTTICDYLDEKYLEPPLYTSDKDADKLLLTKIGPLVGVFTRLILEKEPDKSPEQWVQEFMPLLQEFEDALCKRGAKFYRGDSYPGIVDYTLWPFAERAPIIPMVLGTKLPFQKGSLSLLKQWKRDMAEYSVVKELLNSPEKHFKVLQFHKPNVEPNYDEI